MDDIDRERTIKEVKSLLRRTVESSNCPTDNGALSRVSKFLVDVCVQDGQDPIEHVKIFCAAVVTPNHDIVIHTARRLFFYQLTGGQFSGG
jgi:hypothetical protein